MEITTKVEIPETETFNVDVVHEKPEPTEKEQRLYDFLTALKHMSRNQMMGAIGELDAATRAELWKASCEVREAEEALNHE